jgi:restriction system protein
MPIWLIRAGSHGEYEQKFIQENRVYVTWDRLGLDLSKLHDRDALMMELLKLFPAVPRSIGKCHRPLIPSLQ